MTGYSPTFSVPRTERHGGVVPLVIIAMPMFVGMLGATVDLGLLFVACEQCQVIADAGARAGSRELPCISRATRTAREVSVINAPEGTEFQITTRAYAGGDAVPELGPAPTGGALEVRVARQVRYVFLPILGLSGSHVSRVAVSARQTHFRRWAG